MTGDEFLLRFITPEFEREFEALTDAGRKKVLDALGGPCSSCGSTEPWCCNDPIED